MNTKSVSKRLAAICGAGLVAAAGLGLPNPPAASAATATNATAAIDWLEKELAANDHRFQGSFDGQPFDDLGLTIDALLAIASAGRNSDAEAVATANYVFDKGATYVSFDGPDRYAGPLGKLMVLAQARGVNPASVDGLNLEQELRARLQSNGRFTDKSDFGDFSNGVGQAFDIIALSRTTEKAPASSVTWLLAQQCPNGGFRTDYSEGAACTSDDDADLDGTSFALLALKATGSNATDKINKAIKYLNDNKNATSGLVGNNTNSAGLAASAFRSWGFVPAANAQADKVDDLQVAAGADKGAIALNKADFDGAAGGISAAKRATFQRATSQAVLALGLPSYTDRGAMAPVDPKPHGSASTSTAKPGDSITMTGGGFQAGETVNGTVESDPVSVGNAVAGADGEVSLTFTLPASVTPGTHTIKLLGVTSGVLVSQSLTVTAAQVASTTTTTVAANNATTSTTRVIARGGSSAETQSLFAVVLLGGGVALVLAARQRRVIYPFKKQ